MFTLQVYSIFPNKEYLTDKWQRLEKPFYQSVIDSAVIYSDASNGSWRPVTDVLRINRSKPVLDDCIYRILVKSGRPVAEFPLYIQNSFMNCCRISASSVWIIYTIFHILYDLRQAIFYVTICYNLSVLSGFIY